MVLAASSRAFLLVPVIIPRCLHTACVLSAASPDNQIQSTALVVERPGDQHGKGTGSPSREARYSGDASEV
eukprot:30226-Eustigmatos_ZCMA.PRE.1